MLAVMYAAGCLCAVGMISASFCTSVIQLYLCIGVIVVRLGLAFNLQPALTMIGKYFYKKRPIANGLAMAGSPIGWRGSFLILGGLLLNCCVAGSLMRPLGPPPSKAKKMRELPSQQRSAQFGRLSTSTNLSLQLYHVLGVFAPIVFLAAYAKDMGVDEYSAAFLLSILAFVDMFARPSMGLLANSRWIRPKIQYFFSFAVLYNGVCHILCPLADNYTGLVIYSIFFGFAFGMVSSVLFETLMDLVGAPRFSSAVGLTTIVGVLPCSNWPPLAGVVILASIWLFVGNFINYRLLDRERKQAELYKQTETEDPDRDQNKKETDAEAQQPSQELDEQKTRNLCSEKPTSKANHLHPHLCAEQYDRPNFGIEGAVSSVLPAEGEMMGMMQSRKRQVNDEIFFEKKSLFQCHVGLVKQLSPHGHSHWASILRPSHVSGPRSARIHTTAGRILQPMGRGERSLNLTGHRERVNLNSL
ncbi:hypothetical protein WMY93_021499 [Mugilogobius chulae]|uniref:Monocarboxylate transporter 2 n=1 Tax=Mugilogobius chulae TaxID=88201 RepID=A0AAW0NFI1_9GOBI